MGRGAGPITGAAATLEMLAPAATRHNKRELTDAYQEFKTEKLKLHYLTSDEEVKEFAKALKAMNPEVISLDIETASMNGKWGSLNGSIRLIQMGLDEPDNGIESQQIIVDCHKADPQPILQFLRTRRIEKQIHHMNFEQEWSLIHLGTSIGNIYDTCLAWRVIQSELKETDPSEYEHVLPNYSPHDNKLSTLAELYLGIKIPKDEQSGDWGRQDLSPDQLVYASMDVAILPPLVRFTKYVAESLDIEFAIDERIAKTKESIANTVERKDPKNNDTADKVAMAIGRARSRDELREIERLSRHMPVFASNRDHIKKAVKKQREKLKAA